MNRERISSISLLGRTWKDWRGWIVLLGWLSAWPAGQAHAQPAGPRLELRGPVASNDWVRLRSSFHPNSLLTLEASTNLSGWQTIGSLHDALFHYPDAGTGDFRQRFYRLRVTPRTSTNDWKNELLFPEDPF